MEQGHPGLFGADQEAGLEQQDVEGHGLHGHGLAAHIRAGDDRRAGGEGDGHRDEAPPCSASRSQISG